MGGVRQCEARGACGPPPAFPRRYVQRFRDDFRRVTVARLDAKHFIQEDAPAEISSAIEDFLTSTDVASGAA